MTYDAAFTVLRTSTIDDVTMALVTARVDQEKLKNEPAFLQALIRAVTSWINETEEGRKAWEASSYDFNVGDLAAFLGESLLQKDLTSRLRDQGIRTLSIRIIDEGNLCKFWAYDTILCTANVRRPRR